MKLLSSFDKALMNLLQGNLPISSRPFKALADELDSDEETVLNRIKALKEEGYLRRIGAFFDSDKLGYRSTLIALEVEPNKLAQVAERINAYDGVTHNYEREGVYNLWFTLLVPNLAKEKEIINEISVLPGCVGYSTFPPKINTR